MSFLSAVGGFFKNVGQGVEKVTHYIDPYAGIIAQLPVVGGTFGVIYGLVAQAELLASADSTGAQRKAAVVAFLKLKYPTIDFSAEIDDLVGVLNRIAAKVEAAKPAEQPKP